ncbi:hypothetical protein ABW19_dt0202613 [Dactylella cylindrospora]|nr:hypothetical protein ABW19_dt0202613 [Dactylella cylindrospora]
MEEDTPRSDLSIAELEAHLEDMLSIEINKRLDDETELWMLQEEEKQRIYKTILKKQNSGRAALNSDSQTEKRRPSKSEPAGPVLMRRKSLPPLKTSNIGGDAMEDVVSTALPIVRDRRSVTFDTRRQSPTDERKRQNPFQIQEPEEPAKLQPEDRRFGTGGIPENRLHHVFDRRSPRRDNQPEEARPREHRESKDTLPEEEFQRRSSYDLIRATEDVSPERRSPIRQEINYSSRRASRDIPPETAMHTDRRSVMGPGSSASPSPPRTEPREGRRQIRDDRRHSYAGPSRDLPRSPSPYRRNSGPGPKARRQSTYDAQSGKPWNIWINPGNPSAATSEQAQTESHSSHKEDTPPRERESEQRSDSPRRDSDYDRDWDNRDRDDYDRRRDSGFNRDREFYRRDEYRRRSEADSDSHRSGPRRRTSESDGRPFWRRSDYRGRGRGRDSRDDHYPDSRGDRGRGEFPHRTAFRGGRRGIPRGPRRRTYESYKPPR